MSRATVLGVLLIAGSLCGQTKIDLQKQSREVDFSNATYTKPMKVVYALPATCGLGESVFLATAVAGQNLYDCTAANQWTQQTGIAPDTSGNRTTATSTQVTTAAGTCASSTVLSTTHGAGTITRTAGSDTGLFTIACNSAAALVCYYGAGINSQNYTVTGFAGSACTLNPPSTNIAVLATVAISNGAFSTTPTDFRPDVVVPTVPSAGPGLVSITNGLAVDRTVIPQMFFGSGVPGNIAGNLAGNWYTDTNAKVLYECQKPVGTLAPACSTAAPGDWTIIGPPPAQTFFANGHGTISGSGLATYFAPLGRFDDHETVLANAQLPVPVAGTISHVCAFYQGATTFSDQPVTIALNVNGADDANMVATLPVSSPTGTIFCTPAGLTRAVSTSDLLTFTAQYTGTSGTITSIRGISWTLR